MEHEPTNEGGAAENYTSDLLRRVDAVRAASVETIDRTLAMNDKVATFNVGLQRAVAEQFGDARLCGAVPEWHRLVGSTVEIREIPEAAKVFIEGEIDVFVTELEVEWGI